MAVTTIESAVEDRNVAGIIYLVAGVSLFSIQDVIIKFFSDDLPLLQVMFMRGFVALIPICWLVWRENGWSGLSFGSSRPADIKGADGGGLLHKLLYVIGCAAVG